MTFADKAPIIKHGQKQPPPRERENIIGVLWVLMWARLGREPDHERQKTHIASPEGEILRSRSGIVQLKVSKIVIFV